MGTPTGRVILTHTKAHIHDSGCGFLVGVGVDTGSDTHGFTHDSPYRSRLHYIESNGFQGK